MLILISLVLIGVNWFQLVLILISLVLIGVNWFQLVLILISLGVSFLPLAAVCVVVSSVPMAKAKALK